jgi:cell division protein FtsI/penicillin-binding protein 2
MKSPLREPFAKKVNARIRLLLAGLLLWSLVLAARLVQLQVFCHAAARAEVIEQSHNERVISSERGTIFDRNGLILARSIPARSLFMTPVKGERPEGQRRKVESLKKVLGLTEAEGRSLLARVRRSEPFTYLKRKASPELAKAVEDLGLEGVYDHPDTLRFYPNGPLAAHVLGGVGVDDRGLAGVEFSYDEPLRGKPGRAVILRDARRREYQFEILAEAVPGKDIVLTIDSTLQHIVERELEAGVAASGAKWGAAVIVHPDSGEILALASCPVFDPNAYPLAPEAARFDRAVQLSYEPGSTFKIVTAAAALAHHAVGLGETFDCSRTDLDVPGKPIRDHKPFGILTFPQVVIHSSNKGMVQVGRRVGEAALHDMAAAFGFGRRTGIALAGEAAGRLNPVSAWSRRSLPAMSTGYEVAATPLQVLQVISTVANHGLWTPPHVVKEIVETYGTLPVRKPAPAMQVLSRSAADTLAAILEQVVEQGTGIEARLDGYRIAGKTGTTQKWDPALGAYSDRKHTASFVGFAPVGHPVLAAVVVIDEPRGTSYYGGDVAAPVFREIVRRSLRALGVYPHRAPAPSLITASVWENDRR